MLKKRSAAMTEALSAVAPGRPLRDGLDRIVQANMGALIVIGAGPEVLELCSGGFLVDTEFSPHRMFELAKMDGAIVLTSDCSRIVRVNVQLMPDASVFTSETGTRHRTAERTARCRDVPVISVSEDLKVITVYRNEEKYPLEPVPRMLVRANGALQTLERYKDRLDQVGGVLSSLEVKDLVSLQDVVTVLQRIEMARRIVEEIEAYILELGTEGRLILLQLEELIANISDDRRMVLKDYIFEDDAARLDRSADEATSGLAKLSSQGLLDKAHVAQVLRVPDQSKLDMPMKPRGYGALSKLGRLTTQTTNAIVDHFGHLDAILNARAEELAGIEDQGGLNSSTIAEGLTRLIESTSIR